MYRQSDHCGLATADVELVAVVAQLRGQLRRVERENRNLHRESEVLREVADSFDRGSYYAWVRAQGKRRAREHDDQRLTELIFEVHAAHPCSTPETRSLARTCDDGGSCKFV